MLRKRRVGEMLLRQKAVKILRPRRIRSAAGTDHPSNERTSHPPLQNSLLRSPLRPQRPFQASLPTESLYRPAIHVKQKKGQSEAREHLVNARCRARGAVGNSNEAVVPSGPQLSAGTAPDGWASRHQPQFDDIFSARDASVLRHQSFCFCSSECATAGLVRPWLGALLCLDTRRAGGRMGVSSTASVQQEGGQESGESAGQGVWLFV